MIEIALSGFLFLFIIITNLASGRFGYETFNDLEAEAKLKKINRDPRKFKIALVLIVIEHFAIIALAVSLFLAFNSFNLMLAVVWTISRTLEGAIQIYNKKSYSGIINIAKQYSDVSFAEKSSLIDSARSIQKTKNTVFVSTQLLFSIGTLSYSILFVISSTVVPDYFGWFGIVASLIYGLGNAINLAKSNFKAIWNLGGLLILVFELILGGWLLISPFL